MLSKLNEEILKNLEPLFERAEKENLWFYLSHDKLWFSVEELKSLHISGSFIFDCSEWELRSPFEYLSILEEQKKFIEKKIIDVKSKM